MNMISFQILAILVTFASAEVRHLTDADLPSVIDGSTNVLVEFYAPWCGHCKSLAPEWAVVGETFQPGDDIVIVAVDATIAKKSASKYGITGYPTLKFFPKGSTTPEDFSGGRTADSIVKWVNDKIGTKRKVKAPPSDVIELTGSSFDDIVFDPTKNVLVEFYAPWCGHCKALAPIYEQLGSIFAGDKNVVIAKIDASEESEVAQRFDVSGFPTLKFFPATPTSDPELFEHERELESMVDFINSRAGTFRTVTGGLTKDAGRVSELDELVKDAPEINESLLTSLKTAIESLSDTSKIHAAAYVTTAEKIIAKGIVYVEKEITRLSGMLKSPSISSEKKTGFMLKINVLKAFSKE